MPLPTPNADPLTVTRSFEIPVDLSPFLTGAILTLTREEAWEELGDRTPAECAEFFCNLLYAEMYP